MKLPVLYDPLVYIVCTCLYILVNVDRPCSSLIEFKPLSSQAEPFGKIISQLAAQEGVTEDKIMLSLSDINILGYDTPISIQLSVADIIGEFTHDNQFDVKQDQLVCSTVGPILP